MKELIRVRVQYASRQQCCKTHKRPLPLPLPYRSLQFVKPLPEPNSWSRVRIQKLAVTQLVNKLPVSNGIQMHITFRHGTHMLITRVVWNPNAHNPYVMEPKCPILFVMAPRCPLPVRYGTQMPITLTHWNPNAYYPSSWNPGAHYPSVMEPKSPLPLRTGTLIPITVFTNPVIGSFPEPGASR